MQPSIATGLPKDNSNCLEAAGYSREAPLEARSGKNDGRKRAKPCVCHALRLSFGRERDSRTVEQKSLGIDSCGLLAAGLRSQMSGQAWISFGEFLKRDVLGDARMRHADGSLGAPARLEAHSVRH